MILVAVALLGGFAGSGITYFLVENNDRNLKSQGNDPAKPPLSETGDTPQGIPVPVKFEDTLPQGTISPTTVAAKLQDYTDKEVKLRGLILEISPGKYGIVGQEKKNAARLNLDFSGSTIDPKQYISGFGYEDDSNAMKKTVGAVTVTGTVTSSPTSGGTTIKVKAVQF